MPPQRAQNFNIIRLTTSNIKENNILLREISGQLYINDDLVVTSDNVSDYDPDVIDGGTAVSFTGLDGGDSTP